MLPVILSFIVTAFDISLQKQLLYLKMFGSTDFCVSKKTISMNFPP